MSNSIVKAEREFKKKQIIAVRDNNGDWRSLARTLDVPTSTAYRWVSEGETEDKRGGRRFQKIRQEHLDFFVSAIEKNCRITLNEIKSEFEVKFNMSISKTAVANHLDSLCYTLKEVRHEPERGNAVDNKIKRKHFVEQLLELQAQNKPILFMDETNLNMHISRSQGRSVKGTRCSTVAAGSKGANVHIIGCISTMGLIHYEIRRGSFKKENANEWFKTCFREAFVKHEEPTVMVIDNAPCHSNIEAILEDEEFCNNQIIRLGPYSPMLNPIENVWSVVKAYVKREMANKLISILRLRSEVSMREQRLQALENLMEEGMQTITPTICANAIASIQRKFSAVINMEDMQY